MFECEFFYVNSSAYRINEWNLIWIVVSKTIEDLKWKV